MAFFYVCEGRNGKQAYQVKEGKRMVCLCRGRRKGVKG